MLARIQRKGNCYALLLGMHTSTAIMKKSMESPQKVREGTAHDQAILLPGT